MIEELPSHPSTVDPTPFADRDHPMRKVTRGVAFEHAWSAGRAHKIADLFDGLAPEWSERTADAARLASIEDALTRGGLDLDGCWLELGSGTGVGARALNGRVCTQISLDLSAEMLAHAPDGLAPKIRADSSNLPFRDDTFDVVMMINMLLFPDEVDRVLKPDGSVLWVNTNGDQTPIHLPPHDVAAALPGDWHGTTARAGSGFWTVLRRGRPAKIVS